jgi:hypothetical protein
MSLEAFKYDYTCLLMAGTKDGLISVTSTRLGPDDSVRRAVSSPGPDMMTKQSSNDRY